MRGTASKLSLDLARGTGVHWARLLWVVAVRIFGEPARLSIGNQQDQSQAAPHSPITRDLRENQCLLKQDTDDRPTPRCCLPTGSPLPELRPRGLVEPGQPTWKHSACLCCRCFAENACRCAFVLAAEGGLFFNIHKHHKKTVSDQFFANTTFSFFLVYFWQQPRWSRGLECVWAQPLLRCRDNLAYSVILFTMF